MGRRPTSHGDNKHSLSTSGWPPKAEALGRRRQAASSGGGATSSDSWETSRQRPVFRAAGFRHRCGGGLLPGWRRSVLCKLSFASFSSFTSQPSTTIASLTLGPVHSLKSGMCGRATRSSYSRQMRWQASSTACLLRTHTRRPAVQRRDFERLSQCSVLVGQLHMWTQTRSTMPRSVGWHPACSICRYVNSACSSGTGEMGYRGGISGAFGAASLTEAEAAPRRSMFSWLTSSRASLKRHCSLGVPSGACDSERYGAHLRAAAPSGEQGRVGCLYFCKKVQQSGQTQDRSVNASIGDCVCGFIIIGIVPAPRATTSSDHSAGSINTITIIAKSQCPSTEV